ncbi:MAG: hypothetical protein IPM21_17715 [Acidobacteria bacterium]|nr:hypothetical protein [Acidobacteriota bacterium]
MARENKVLRKISVAAGLALLIGAGAIAADAQRPQPTRTPTPRPTATPAIPEVISRADDLPWVSIPDSNEPAGRPVVDSETRDQQTIETLEARIKLLESTRSRDPDAVQKRLALNLDILTRAEQRSDTLRRQLFEMLEKEGTVLAKLDSIEMDMRPEMIDRGVAFAGTLRPEELREARRRQLTAEKANQENLLNEIRRNRSNLEVNLQKADDLVERLRVRIEREIDAALDETNPANKPPDQDL